MGQDNENDAKPESQISAKYMDIAITDTLHRTPSKASTLRDNKLSDPIVKAFPLGHQTESVKDGIVAFVSNNSFIDQIVFRRNAITPSSRLRQLLYCSISVETFRKNPKLSGTTHNVFGIQVGVSINPAQFETKKLAPLQLNMPPLMSTGARARRFEFLDRLGPWVDRKSMATKPTRRCDVT